MIMRKDVNVIISMEIIIDGSHNENNNSMGKDSVINDKGLNHGKIMKI